MKKLILLLSCIALLASCNNGRSPEPINGETIPGQTMENNAAKPATNEKKAVVLEAMNAGTYTYLLLKGDGKEFWAAVTARQVEIGKSYYYTESIWMKDFESKQLQKTFDSILFIDYFGEHPNNAGKVSQTTSPADHKSTSREEYLKVTPAGGGISLEELFGNKEKYKGKKVLVSGKVVKISRSIMNRNWIHVQDGTSYEGQYDLTVTLNGTIGFEMNDVVTFRGTINLDRDFGAGYHYDVIMEDAVIVEKDR